MKIIVFEGTESREITAEEAYSFPVRPDSEIWIDVLLNEPTDPEGVEFLVKMGLRSRQVRHLLESNLELGFRVEPEGVHGVCWLDDNDGTPVEQALFTWHNHRLITVRTDGDEAMRLVRHRLADRAETLGADPTRLLGDVLELMMATVQRGIAELAVMIGDLDMEIIQTSRPSATQSRRLGEYRAVLQPLASRFPIYRVNVSAALIDPPRVRGLSDAAAQALADYAQSTVDTEEIIESLEDDIRDAAQDLQAQVVNWQGNRINALTVVTMVFLPISFLTGYFGMNFGWLDIHLKSDVSFYAYGLGLMVVVAAVSFVMLWGSGYSIGLGFGRSGSSGGPTATGPKGGGAAGRKQAGLGEPAFSSPSRLERSMIRRAEHEVEAFAERSAGTLERESEDVLSREPETELTNDLDD